jgi:molecular chaperone GrpE (heat shock protein)
MYSLFDYYFTPPTRTVYVVSEEQLEKLKRTQKQNEIKEVKVQIQELDNAYNRRKSEFEDTLANLEAEVKKLEAADGES